MALFQCLPAWALSETDWADPGLKVTVESWYYPQRREAWEQSAFTSQSPDDVRQTGGYYLDERMAVDAPGVIRATALLVPPATGPYVFTYSGDLDAKLDLTPPSQPPRQIIKCGSGTKVEEWDKKPEQKSQPILLTAGIPVEIVLTASRTWYGKREIALAWEGPGFTRRIIRPSDLQPRPSSNPTVLRADSVIAACGQEVVIDPSVNDILPGEPLPVTELPVGQLGLWSRRGNLLSFKAGAVPGFERLSCKYQVDGQPRTADLDVVVGPALDATNVRRTLLNGVSVLPAEFTRGKRLLPMGPQADGLFDLNLNGNTIRSGVYTSAIAVFGKGRIAVLPLQVLNQIPNLQGDPGKVTAAMLTWLQAAKPNVVRATTNAPLATWNPSFPMQVTAQANWRTILPQTDVMVLNDGDVADSDIELLTRAVAEQGKSLLIGLDQSRGPASRLLVEMGIFTGDQAQGGFDPAKPEPDFQGAKLSRWMREGVSIPGDQYTSQPLVDDLNAIDTTLIPRRSHSDAQFRDRPQSIAAYHTSIGLTPGREFTAKGTLVRYLINREAKALMTLPLSAVTAHRTSLLPGGMYSLPPAAPRLGPTTAMIDTTLTGYFPLGLHVPAGEPVLFKVPTGIVGANWKILVGDQGFDLEDGDEVKRMSQMQWTYGIGSEVVQITHPYGGPAYLYLPKSARSPRDAGLPDFAVEVKGAVASPLFVLGKTSVEDWKSHIRLAPGPRAEFFAPCFSSTFPSDYVRTLDDPTEPVQFFDRLVQLYDGAGGHGQLRRGPDRVCLDIQPGAYAGYPIHGHESWCENMFRRDPRARDALACAGPIHELSHEAQRRPDKSWSYWNGYTKDAEGSITIFDSVGTRGVFGRGQRTEWVAERFYFDESMRVMMKASVGNGNTSTHGGPGLFPYSDGSVYVFLTHAFGADIWPRFIGTYTTGITPSTDQDKRDQWLIRFSSVSGKDMTPFFVGVLKLPVTPRALAEVRAMQLPPFYPAVGGLSEAATLPGVPITLPLAAEGLSFDGVCEIGEVTATGGELKAAGAGLWTYTPVEGFTGDADCTYETISSAGSRVINPLRIHVGGGGINVDLYPFGKPAKSPQQLDAMTPLRSALWDQFRTPWCLGGNYTARLRGILHPEISGTSQFGLLAYQGAKVWLYPKGSTRPAAATYSSSVWWRASARYNSELFSQYLVAGQDYEVEVVMTVNAEGVQASGILPNGWSNDHLALYWTPPGKHGLYPIGDANVKPQRVLARMVPLPTQTFPFAKAADYLSWAVLNAGGQAGNLDFNRNGVPNNVEYLMGRTGSGPTPNLQPVAGVVTWPKNPLAAASYVVETSTDLVTWKPAATGVTDRVTSITYTLPPEDRKRFTRLRVTTP